MKSRKEKINEKIIVMIGNAFGSYFFFNRSFSKVIDYKKFVKIDIFIFKLKP